MERKRGFTLVEVLVVFGIVTVLLAFLLPAMQRSRESADRVAAVSQMRQIGVAIMQYAHDQDGRLPGPLQVGQKALHQPNETRQLASVLGPYLGVTNLTQPSLVKVFLAPAFVRGMKGKNLNQSHPFLVNINPTANGQPLKPFGSDAPGKEAAPMKLPAVPSNLWVLCDADQENPGVIGQPWADNTPSRIIHGIERLGLRFDGSVQSLPASEIPPAGGPPGGPPGPPPPPPPPPH